jgi:hypothetical protein
MTGGRPVDKHCVCVFGMGLPAKHKKETTDLPDVGREQSPKHSATALCRLPWQIVMTRISICQSMSANVLPNERKDQRSPS